MSIMSEDVQETQEKANIRARHKKNPVTCRKIKPSHMRKRNQKRNREVAGVLARESDLEQGKNKKKKIVTFFIHFCFLKTNKNFCKYFQIK